MAHPFFKQQDFMKDIIVPLHPKQYTVVVIYLDGYRKEYNCIEQPQPFINKVKKNPKVKTCFIK